MKHETDKIKEIIIEDSSENLDTWINRDYISDNLKDELRKADILIVPIEGFRGDNTPLFPNQTHEILSFLRDKLPKDHQIDICIDDDKYLELSLQYDLWNIGHFVLTGIVVPVFSNLIKEYINKKIVRPNKTCAINVKFTIIKKNGISKTLSYEGDAQYFDSVIDEINKLKD